MMKFTDRVKMWFVAARPKTLTASVSPVIVGIALVYDEIIAKIEEHNITWLVVENNTDTSLKTLLEQKLKEKGIYTCIITEKYNTIKKEMPLQG